MTTETTQITEKDITHLAQLSRIELSAEETTSLMGEIGSILAYVDLIKKAPMPEGGVAQEASVGLVKNVTRPDASETIAADVREQILNSAPDREGDFVAVKRILS